MPYAISVVRLARRKSLTRFSSPCDFRLRARRCRVHCIPHPTSVTIAIRPSYRGGTTRTKSLIWGNRQASTCREPSIAVRPNSALTKRWCDRPRAAANSSPTGKLALARSTRSGRHRRGEFGMPTQVVVPSDSWAAEVHGLAGTIFVEMPSSPGMAKPVGEKVWFSAAEIPLTAGGAAGADRPSAGGEAPPCPLRVVDGLLEVLPPAAAPVAFAVGATPPAAGIRAAGTTSEMLADPVLLVTRP